MTGENREFSGNLAEVRNWKAKVFALLLFISTAVLALKTTFCEEYKVNPAVEEMSKKKKKLNPERSPSLGDCNYLIILSRRFQWPIYFQFEFISNSDPHGNLSNQLQSQARTNVDV